MRRCPSKREESACNEFTEPQRGTEVRKGVNGEGLTGHRGGLMEAFSDGGGGRKENRRDGERRISVVKKGLGNTLEARAGDRWNKGKRRGKQREEAEAGGETKRGDGDSH